MQHIFVTLYYVQWLGMMWSSGAMEGAHVTKSNNKRMTDGMMKNAATYENKNCHSTKVNVNSFDRQ